MSPEQSLPGNDPTEITRDEVPDTEPVTAIEVDSHVGLKLGLNSKIFVPCSQCSEDYPFGTQLFRKGDAIYIQVVEIWHDHRKQGHFKALLRKLWSLNFTVKVPNPTRSMEEKLIRMGFTKVDEHNPMDETQEIEVVYVKPPPL